MYILYILFVFYHLATYICNEERNTEADLYGDDADRPRIQEKRRVVSGRGGGRGRREGLVRGQRSLRSVSASSSRSGRQSMTVMEEDENLANVEGERIASTETDCWEAIPSGSQHVLTQEPLAVNLPTH